MLMEPNKRRVHKSQATWRDKDVDLIRPGQQNDEHIEEIPKSAGSTPQFFASHDCSCTFWVKIMNIKRKLLNRPVKKFGCSLCFHEAVETSMAHLFCQLFKLHLVMALKRSTNSSVKKAVQILGSEQTTNPQLLEDI